MSIKSNFTSILKDVDARNQENRTKITQICNNTVYSREGKLAEIEKVNASTAVYIADQKKAVTDAVEKKIAEIDAEEADRLKMKNSDADYQSLLASTIQILPALVAADPGALKNRLSVFNDDPVAVAAITETLRKATHSGNGSEGQQAEFDPSYMDVLPTDSRGERQKRLRQLENTMNNHLDAMAFNVQEKALKGGENANVVTVHGGSNVNATLGYIEACTNDDCTEVDVDSLYA